MGVGEKGIQKERESSAKVLGHERAMQEAGTE